MFQHYDDLFFKTISSQKLQNQDYEIHVIKTMTRIHILNFFIILPRMLHHHFQNFNNAVHSIHGFLFSTITEYSKLKQLTESCKYCITPSIICGNIASICLWHPSPTADIAIRAACLNTKFPLSIN